MVGQEQVWVVILDEDALVGKGSAGMRRAQLGYEGEIGSEDDPKGVASTLGLGPAVVIFEMGDTLRQFDLTTLAPQAVLIDVSTVVTRGLVVSSGVAGMERILQAVRTM